MCSGNVNHKPMQSNQVGPSSSISTVDLSAHTEQSSRPSGPTRTVDLSAFTEQSSQIIKTNQDSGSVSPHRAVKQSSQTIRTNQDSESVRPHRAVKLDHKDQPGRWVCLHSGKDQLGPRISSLKASQVRYSIIYTFTRILHPKVDFHCRVIFTCVRT